MNVRPDVTAAIVAVMGVAAALAVVFLLCVLATGRRSERRKTAPKPAPPWVEEFARTDELGHPI